MGKLQVVGLVLVNVCMLVGGQVAWKAGMAKLPQFSVSELIRSPLVITGLGIYGIATLLWLYILRHSPLSFAYPLQSISYVLGMAAGVLLFGETLKATSVIGALLILAGAIFIAR